MQKLKTRSGRTIVLPTDEEDRQINAGIAADPDTEELGEDFFKRARPAREVLPAAVFEQLVALKRPRGRPVGSVSPNTKKLVSIRLDPEVIAAARASGEGWQTRVNEILRREFLKA
ncbi:hypothetical protein GT347_06365 [Xylophilus rhododendri]|uniref:BrnA antitoxin family protein n=1 Tax=Xylophilus rhododendri TaxID=2697032 RepID=A0A857J459_9BURK|nr:BrnA antitoxin family protein [Xylophilus rhododendri]QHI97645.1 hypothetical protein GT347_06365 [Xylophilus rhododendri]